MNEHATGFGLETKFARIDREASSGCELVGYASFFGAPDQNGDVVERGAFAKSLSRLRGDGRSVKFLWQHDPAQPIGVWEEVSEDERGLVMRGRLLTDVAKGAEAATLLASGAVDGLSIGYRTVRAEKAGAGRRLIELDLWEVSLVTFPMLPSARAAVATTDPDEEIARALSDALSDARRALA